MLQSVAIFLGLPQHFSVCELSVHQSIKQMNIVIWYELSCFEKLLPKMYFDATLGSKVCDSQIWSHILKCHFCGKVTPTRTFVKKWHRHDLVPTFARCNESLQVATQL
jgi:hypothetical protein